jgi:hypothetical protein
MNDNIINSFYVYFIIMILLFLIKPDFLIYEDKNKCMFKQFGCGKNKTIINIHLLSIILSILIYFLTRFLNKNI